MAHPNQYGTQPLPLEEQPHVIKLGDGEQPPTYAPSPSTGGQEVATPEEPVDVIEGSDLFAQAALARAASQHDSRPIYGLPPENDRINRRRQHISGSR